MKISVLIPVYNERHTIEQVLLDVEKVPVEKEIIVIDDGSTDGTRQLLENIHRNKKIILRLYFSRKIGVKGMQSGVD